MGRWLLGLLVLAVVVAIGVLWSPVPRGFVAGRLDAETRNSFVAFTSRLTARPAGTGDLVPIAHTGVNPYGVNVFLNQEVEEDKIRRSLEMIRDAGFGWVKMQMLWYEIERPAKGQYIGEQGEDTWAKYDRIVELAGEYRLGLVLRLDTSPDWARPGRTKIETPPDNLEDYADFVERVVSRYRGKVRYYQIWNEPNLEFEWGNRRPEPAEYVRMLCLAYRRAKAADPDSVIISAALAPTIEVSERATSDLVFLQGMYDAGGRDCFDIVSSNPYGLRSGPDDHRLDPDEDVNFSRPVLVRELMVRNGDAAKPIWAAELGWNALPPDFAQEPLFGRVSRQLQAKYTVRAYQRAQEEWPWMAVMNLWHFRMIHGPDKEQQQYYFGMVDDNFHPYPVYEAMKALATQPPSLGRGYHQESHWALRYSGLWQAARSERAVLGAYRQGEPGAELSFTFQGTDLELVTGRLPGGGRLLVAIDGATPPGRPRDEAGQAYLTLGAAQAEWGVRIPLATALPAGRHEVRLVAADGPVIIDGLVVDRKEPPLLAHVVLVLSLSATAVVVAWLLNGPLCVWRSP